MKQAPPTGEGPAQTRCESEGCERNQEGSALVSSKPNKPSFRKPCMNKNGGECQKGCLPRPRFSVTLPFQQGKRPMASCQHVSRLINRGRQTVGVITSVNQKQYFSVLPFRPTRLVGCAGHGSRGCLLLGYGAFPTTLPLPVYHHGDLQEVLLS